MLFPLLGLKKPMNILEPNLSGVITSIRSTNSQHLVQIGCEMAPLLGGEIQRFVTVFSRLFLFFLFPRQPA